MQRSWFWMYGMIWLMYGWCMVARCTKVTKHTPLLVLLDLLDLLDVGNWVAWVAPPSWCFRSPLTSLNRPNDGHRRPDGPEICQGEAKLVNSHWEPSECGNEIGMNSFASDIAKRLTVFDRSTYEKLQKHPFSIQRTNPFSILWILWMVEFQGPESMVGMVGMKKQHEATLV